MTDGVWWYLTEVGVEHNQNPNLRIGDEQLLQVMNYKKS